MTASTRQTTANRKRRVYPGALGYDFAALGLQACESSVEKIRQAAMRKAAHIHQADAVNDSQVDSMLAELASSTYRLLDPRRRMRAMERIQLSIYSESDLELQSGSREPLIQMDDNLLDVPPLLRADNPFHDSSLFGAHH
jgi:hypothetical protein